MLKFLVILVLSVYILSKVGTFFFKMGAGSQQPRAQQRRPEGKINVDPNSRKERKGTDIKGGEYVDYEEVK
jgi:hypothetical protein